MTPLVTVIVPIYNVEKYLERCINSILLQSYRNIEIYLVDDGSPDLCGKYCDKYAELDSRVKVIHKKNGGLSDARNVALDVCSGDYITFIDSDDWVSALYVENLVKSVQYTKSKLAASWFLNVYEGNAVTTPSILDERNIKLFNTESALKRMFYQDGIETSAWGKLYAKELFDGIRYPIGKLYEDVPVTHQLIERAGGASVIPNIDYYYFQRKESIQNQSFNPSKLDAIKHWEDVIKQIDQKFPSLSVAVRSRYFRGICNILFQVCDENDTKYRDELWDKAKKVRMCVLRDRNSKKSSRLAALLSYFGFSITRKVYYVTQRLFKRKEIIQIL